MVSTSHAMEHSVLTQFMIFHSLLICPYSICRVNKDLATIVNINNLLPFISKADMSEDNVTKCLGAFES